MLLYFNKNGQLLESLEYGSTPRVGTTEFKIFAYFEDLDDYSEYSTAMIRFKKPDLQNSEYPDLFMTQKILNYADSDTNYFKAADNPYNGFEFDFDKVSSNGNKVKLLDVPGMWEATITLYKSEDSSYVTGLVRFYVEPAVYEDDDDLYDPDINVVISNIRNLLIDDYVPYQGANEDVNLGAHKITANSFYISDYEMAIDRNNDDLRIFNQEGDIYLISNYVEIGGNTKINGYVQTPAIKFDDELHSISLDENDNLTFNSGTGSFIFSPDDSAIFNCDVYIWGESLKITEDSHAPKMVAKNNYGNDTVENTTWSFYTEETEEVAETVHFASKEWVKPSIPKFQSGVAIIKDLTTNINGWVLSNYGYEEVTILTYSAYKITTAGGATLTEAQARTYMRCMSGSDFLPTYDFNRPTNSFFATAEGEILKPQFDNSNGLVLYKVSDIASKDWVEELSNNYLDLGMSYTGTLTDEQYAYALRNDAVLKNVNSFFRKVRETDSQITFYNRTGVSALTNNCQVTVSLLTVNKTTKEWTTADTQGTTFYSRAQMDNIISTLRRNAYRKVDITTYTTLNEFLASNGEEGYVYLYPINTSDLTQGYYQYIWEDDAWMDLGTSNVDLSDYATIAYVSSNYATLDDLQRAISESLGTVESELDALDVGQGV